MKGQSTGPALCALFVDYDNIYMSLRRKNEEAARRFAKDAGSWLREIESGRLIRPTNGLAPIETRRIVMNRCYGNPVPRRNAADNSTDMSSFPFVRHHFLRAGFEVIDCPPLTAQLKNSADIRMVLDVLEHLTHNTYFDEFVILSGDADFTPVLHKLRAHARRTVVYANDHTAQPYTAISDGEVREADLISLLIDGEIAAPGEAREALPAPTPNQLEAVRREIITEITAMVRNAAQPVPLEALADRAVRTLGYEKTVGSSWAGAGGFRDLLMKALPETLRISEQPPYFVYDTSRQIAPPAPDRRPEREPQALQAAPQQQIAAPAREERRAEVRFEASAEPPGLPPAAVARQPAPPHAAPAQSPTQAAFAPAREPRAPALPQQQFVPQPAVPQASLPPPPAQPPQRTSEQANAAIQASIARIHEACQAPPLQPAEYRVLFEALADEINANNLSGAQTLVNIAARARERGVELRREDIRFALEVVSETDPWFEQGASANLFASRFRNFVVARCRSHGLALSSDELDLIEAWFGGSPAASRAPAQVQGQGQAQATTPAQQPVTRGEPQQQTGPGGDRWWSLDEGRQHVAGTHGYDAGGEEFPRIIRSRIRG